MNMQMVSRVLLLSSVMICRSQEASSSVITSTSSVPVPAAIPVAPSQEGSPASTVSAAKPAKMASSPVEIKNQLAPVPGVITEIAPSGWDSGAEFDPELSDVDEEAGNWYEKQKIFKKARVVNDQIQEIVPSIAESEKKAFEVRQKIDEFMNQFYQESGFIRGELTGLIDVATDEILADHKINEKERSVLIDVQERKKELEELKKTTEFLHKIDEQSVHFYSAVTAQIAQAHSFEEKSWQNYEKIAEVRSDEIAAQLFLEMQTIFENLQKSNKYLQDDLLPYGIRLLQQLEAQIKLVNEKITSLKERGIILKKEVQKVEKKEQAVPQKLVKKGLFAKIGDFFVSIWRAITAFISRIWS